MSSQAFTLKFCLPPRLLPSQPFHVGLEAVLARLDDQLRACRPGIDLLQVNRLTDRSQRMSNLVIG